MKGVREDSRYGKQICVLAEDLKGTIEPNVLYSVELKPMHKAKGYVVVAATPVPFPATVETIIAPKTLYKITVSFGNKTIYLDPKDKKSAMSQTLDGVPQILKERKVIEDYEVQLLVTLIILDVWILFGQKKDIFVKNKNNG